MGDLRALSAEDFAALCGAVEAEKMRRLLSRGPESPAPVELEESIGVAQLARRLGWTEAAARSRLRRPSWRWLADLGEQHRQGTHPRWRWSEVQQHPSYRGGK